MMKDGNIVPIMRARGCRGQDARAAPDKQDAWRIISHYVQLPPTAWSVATREAAGVAGLAPHLN